MDDQAVALALDMYRSGDFKVAEIVVATGVSKSTLYRRLAAAKNAVVEGGRQYPYRENAVPSPPPEGLVVSTRGTKRACALPNWDYFSKRLADVRVHERKDIYAEYVAACEAIHERPYSFNSFCSGLLAWRRSLLMEEEPQWLPGECMTTYWTRIDLEDGHMWAFVARMVFSDATYVCRSEGVAPRHWMACCKLAFEYFGGVPHITDCSVFGASSGGISYCARATLEGFAAHYRTVLFGARPKTGKTADKSTKPLTVKNSSVVLNGIRKELCALGQLDSQRIDRKIEKSLEFYNKTSFSSQPSRWELLEERELPQMLSLPAEPYDMATWDVRCVAPDHHITLDRAKYSVPYELAGQTVRIRYTKSEVRAYHGGELVACHSIIGEDVSGKRVSTDDAHRPPGHRWFAKRIDTRFCDMAKECGPSTVKVMKVLLARCRVEGQGFRACKELVDLRRLPSVVTLEEACSAVLSAGGQIDVANVRAVMEA